MLTQLNERSPTSCLSRMWLCFLTMLLLYFY